MRNRRWLVCVLWAVAGIAMAARPPAADNGAEAGIQVDGTILVGPEGKTAEYELKGAGILPAEVRRFLDFHIPRWEFEPAEVDGKPVALRNRMGIYLVAVPHADGGMRIVLRSAYFMPTEKEGGYDLVAARMPPPTFPEAAREAGAEATVYLVARIGRDGKVIEAIDEQVNLHFLAERDADKWRDIFARSAIKAAQGWRFHTPTRGPAAAQESWQARIPVSFTFDDRNRYGRWQAYVPGPRRPVPWLSEQEQGQSLEGMAGGSVHPVGLQGGLKLSAPLQGN